MRRVRWLTFNDRPLYTRGIVAGLRQLGVEVPVIRLRTGPEPQNREIAQAIDGHRPDLVFTPGWAHDLVDPVALFSVLRRKGIPHVYWATEDPTFFHEVSLKFAPYSDLVFTTTVELVGRYVQLGIPTGVLLFGCNPEIHRPVPREPEFEYDVVLVANNYITGSHRHEVRQRTTEQMVMPLVKAGLDVKIWGLW
ncbi:MAG: hypothetical protein AB1445_09220 [Bacillota bacterium]